MAIKFKWYLALRCCAHEKKTSEEIFDEMPSGHYLNEKSVKSLMYALTEDGLVEKSRAARGGFIPTFYEITAKGTQAMLEFEVHHNPIIRPAFVFEESDE